MIVSAEVRVQKCYKDFVIQKVQPIPLTKFQDMMIWYTRSKFLYPAFIFSIQHVSDFHLISAAFNKIATFNIGFTGSKKEFNLPLLSTDYNFASKPFANENEFRMDYHEVSEIFMVFLLISERKKQTKKSSKITENVTTTMKLTLK